MFSVTLPFYCLIHIPEALSCQFSHARKIRVAQKSFTNLATCCAMLAPACAHSLFDNPPRNRKQLLSPAIRCAFDSCTNKLQNSTNFGTRPHRFTLEGSHFAHARGAKISEFCNKKSCPRNLPKFAAAT